MTEVSFHLNVPDADAYVCRLLRKAYAKGARVWVVADESRLGALDRALWLMGQGDFVPHARSSAPSHVRQHTPILLGDSDVGGEGVLVNLSTRMPENPAAFERVIEVVGTQETAREQARARWKQYRNAGFAPQAVDLSSRSEG
ncbi:DNA polymerase III subunit chi [Hydrogenophaga sp. MI9]|uniref:DNA polymerase III subunit chi n=1 Tax=Hydrogenophaga sp. MI9 TaxID=3453719 RepID=UPI003EE9AE69